MSTNRERLLHRRIKLMVADARERNHVLDEQGQALEEQSETIGEQNKTIDLLQKRVSWLVSFRDAALPLLSGQRDALNRVLMLAEQTDVRHG